jgi:hypothetical protein
MKEEWFSERFRIGGMFFFAFPSRRRAQPKKGVPGVQRRKFNPA